MSWRVANTCAERKFGSATRKQIIMFLADKASDDGSGIWCSKGTIQRHTELGETTVKRTVREFLKEGILVETGARTCKNGFTVVYRIDLARVEALESTAEPEIETGSTVAPVQSGPGTGATVAGVPGPPRPPNHPKTIHKPPTRKRDVAGDEEAQKILAGYPPDRLRGKASCLGCCCMDRLTSDTEGFCFTQDWRCCMDHCHLGTRPTRDGFHAVRAKQGRPSAVIRLSTRTPILASVFWLVKFAPLAWGQ